FAAARAACPADMPRLQLDPQVLFLSLNALVLQQLGDTAGAEAWSRDALAYATGRDDPVNLAYTYVLTSQFRALADDRPGTIAWADRAMAVAAEHGFPLHEAAARAMKGWALRDPALQRDGYLACVATGQRTCEPMYRLRLARTYLDLDRVADGASWPRAWCSSRRAGRRGTWPSSIACGASARAGAARWTKRKRISGLRSPSRTRSTLGSSSCAQSPTSPSCSPDAEVPARRGRF